MPRTKNERMQGAQDAYLNGLRDGLSQDYFQRPVSEYHFQYELGVIMGDAERRAIINRQITGA